MTTENTENSAGFLRALREPSPCSLSEPLFQHKEAIRLRGDKRVSKAIAFQMTALPGIWVAALCSSGEELEKVGLFIHLY